MGRRIWGMTGLVGLLTTFAGCPSDDDAEVVETDTETESGTTTTTGGSTTTTTSGTTATTTSGTTTTTTTGAADTSSDGSTDAGMTTGGAVNTDFEEVEGVVVFEAEHFTSQSNNQERQLYWYEISVGSGDLLDEEIMGCVPDTPCTDDNTPLCNVHADCDGDGLDGNNQDFSDPADASGETYLEILPDRRREDEGFEEPSGGFTNNGGEVGVLTYRVFFNQTGRYYAYCRARGRGPAANGLHLGIDGQWPSNTLGDNSVMRWQFPSNGQWRFVNHRRGGEQHTGGVNVDGVSFEDSNMWIEVTETGWHDVQVSMREDGVEIDKFMLVLDPNDAPGEEDLGPDETVYQE